MSTKTIDFGVYQDPRNQIQIRVNLLANKDMK